MRTISEVYAATNDHHFLGLYALHALRIESILYGRSVRSAVGSIREACWNPRIEDNKDARMNTNRA